MQWLVASGAQKRLSPGTREPLTASRCSLPGVHHARGQNTGHNQVNESQPGMAMKVAVSKQQLQGGEEKHQQGHHTPIPF